MAHGLGTLINGLRSALSGEGSGSGTLRLSITSPQGHARAAGAPGDQIGTAVAGEAQPLLGGGGSGGGGSGSLPAAAEEVLQPHGNGPAAGSGPSAAFSGGAGSGLAEVAAGGGMEEGDVAAAAEQHRLTSLQSSLDLRAIALALERGLPYVTLLAFLFTSLHVEGLAAFAFLTYVLFRLNRVVRAQVALKGDRRSKPLVGVAGVVCAQVLLSLVLLRRQDMGGNLVLAGAAPPTEFWAVVFAVVVCDTLLRYLSVLAKVAVLLSVPVDTPARFRRRGQLLTAVEYMASVYRQLPPAPLWYHFFNQAAGTSLLRTGLSGAYLLIKAQHVFERAALAAMAVQQVAVRGYGSTPSSEEVQEAGNSCPICQDAFRDPVRLSCTHVFCQDCCGEWFERERTCPMCRAAVGPANKKFKSKSDGSTPLFPTIF